MSNSEDFDAINNYMNAQESRAGDYPAIIPLIRDWRNWASSISTFFGVSDEDLTTAKRKRDALKAIYNEAPPWTPADKEPAVFDPSTGKLDVSVTAPSKTASAKAKEAASSIQDYGPSAISERDAIITWQGKISAPLTGVFDLATHKATIAWQTKYGVNPADGIVGKKTWSAAGVFQVMPLLQLTTAPAPKTGDSPSLTLTQAIPIWQGIIGTPVDGKLGPNTYNATLIWQKNHGCTVDGVVGPNTWKAAGYVNYAKMPIIKTNTSGGTVKPIPPVPVPPPSPTPIIASVGTIAVIGLAVGAIYKAYRNRMG